MRHREAKQTLLETVARITAQRRDEVAQTEARGETYQVKSDLLDGMLHNKEVRRGSRSRTFLHNLYSPGAVLCPHSSNRIS